MKGCPKKNLMKKPAAARKKKKKKKRSACMKMRKVMKKKVGRQKIIKRPAMHQKAWREVNSLKADPPGGLAPTRRVHLSKIVLLKAKKKRRMSRHVQNRRQEMDCHTKQNGQSLGTWQLVRMLLV